MRNNNLNPLPLLSSPVTHEESKQSNSFSPSTPVLELGATVKSPYGPGIIKAIRKDGMLSIEPIEWIIPTNKPPIFYVSSSVILARDWNEADIARNQEDFAPAGNDPPDGHCICF